MANPAIRGFLKPTGEIGDDGNPVEEFVVNPRGNYFMTYYPGDMAFYPVPPPERDVARKTAHFERLATRYNVPGKRTGTTKIIPRT